MSKLSLQDKRQLSYWLGSKATLAEVEAVPRFGLVNNERFTERARDAYRFLWTWGALRFEGRAGRLQDTFQWLHGKAALDRRIARVQRLIKWL